MHQHAVKGEVTGGEQDKNQQRERAEAEGAAKEELSNAVPVQQIDAVAAEATPLET